MKDDGDDNPRCSMRAGLSVKGEIRFRAVLCLLSGILLMAGCNLNPPVVPSIPEERTGRIFVSANIDGATIYLDNVSTNKLTPDTIAATAGMHAIRLEMHGMIPVSASVVVVGDSVTAIHLALGTAAAARVVLLEDFSNVSCIPCVTSDLILRALVGGTYSRSRVVALKYATNFPAPNDPFYAAAQTLCDSRMSFYNILFAPTLIVDGVRRPTPTDSVAIKDSINASLNAPPKFSVTVTKALAGNIYSTEVVVRVLDTAGVDFSTLVLQTTIVEQEVSFATPPGANGETVFRDVVRAMLPAASGEQMPVLPPGGQAVFQRQTTVASGWNASSLQSVAFLQHRQNRVVYQAGSTY
jgi:hypothetical protein